MLGALAVLPGRPHARQLGERESHADAAAALEHVVDLVGQIRKARRTAAAVARIAAAAARGARRHAVARRIHRGAVLESIALEMILRAIKAEEEEEEEEEEEQRKRRRTRRKKEEGRGGRKKKKEEERDERREVKREKD